MKPPTNPNILNTTTRPEPTTTASADEPGWYLYGVTFADIASRLAASPSLGNGAPLLALEQDGLAALARLVPRHTFSAAAIQERAHDIGWLEETVRNHNLVVERIHQLGPVLPAKFGSIYSDSGILQASLAETHDALFARLMWLQGCDEWGVHVYADRQALQRATTEDPTLKQMQADIASAGPGRAYLLKRKLADAIADISGAALATLAQTSYQHLADYAVAGQRNPASLRPASAGAECELLYASFLVQRAVADDFLLAAQRLVQEQEGLRCEYSGPWPPYSFASADGKEDHE